MKEILAFHSTFEGIEDWRENLAPLLPDIEILDASEVKNSNRVRYVLVWEPPLGFFDRFDNLQLIINLGAGVDQLIERTDIPLAVPIVRLSDQAMAQMMASYALFAVLRHARDIPYFEVAQRRREWSPRVPKHSFEISVAVLGLGELGGLAATEIARHGFDTHGWATRPRDLAGVTVHTGADTLLPLISKSDIVVSMLPLTPETRKVLDTTAFSAMKRGAAFVNLSRGAVVDEPALIYALATGHLSGATLDVFENEPLPSESPLWNLPGVLITPHLASAASPKTSAEQIAWNVTASITGAPFRNEVSRVRGY